MENLTLLNSLSKSTIENAIATGEWIDGKLLTRRMTHKLREFIADMPDSVIEIRFVF